MTRIDIFDFMKLQIPNKDPKMVISIRGCRGSGKSTIPMSMLETDSDAFEVTWKYTARPRVVATVSPKYGFIMLGKYQSKLHGLDSIGESPAVRDAIEAFWNSSYHLLMEGSTTARSPYIDMFNEFNKNYTHRKVIIYNLFPSIDECLSRIGLADSIDVQHQWKAHYRNVKHFKKAGFLVIHTDNENISSKQALNHFFNALEQGEEFSHEEIKKPKIAPKRAITIPAYAAVHVDVPESDIMKEWYLEPSENLAQYPWYSDYVIPNADLKISKTYMDNFWYFLVERMNIWYKRVVLGEPAPWTDDPILQQFKFTNVIRDLDRLSVYERKNILSKVDEIPNFKSDYLKDRWIKSVLLNIMIFRLWVKIDTYEVSGFVNLADFNWQDKWKVARAKLLERREQGISNFTAAYYVNNLRRANRDPATKNNKTQNAICMIEDWMDRIDYIYENAIVKAKNMKEQMDFFKKLPCVGDFTAYEFACSIAEIGRYFQNPLVSWTQDDNASLGPGAQRGVNWIFRDKGGMNDYQCTLYLRSIWKHELQERGTYDRFISQLPKEMNDEIDLRVIEQTLCETQKYNKALTQTGRPKEAFFPKTQNVEELRG